jgi:hypothetical protein
MSFWHGEEESIVFCQAPWAATYRRSLCFLSSSYTQLSGAAWLLSGSLVVHIRICRQSVDHFPSSCSSSSSVHHPFHKTKTAIMLLNLVAFYIQTESSFLAATMQICHILWSSSDGENKKWLTMRDRLPQHMSPPFRRLKATALFR